jgi:hypothetical protein
MTYDKPVAFDNVGLASLGCDIPSGIVLGWGRHRVNCSALDVSGLESKCAFEVIRWACSLGSMGHGPYCTHRCLPGRHGVA